MKNSKLAAFLGNEMDVVEVEDNELRCWYSPSKKQTVLIRDMDTIYILNCIKLIEGKGKTNPSPQVLAKKDDYLKWFREELKKREDGQTSN